MKKANKKKGYVLVVVMILSLLMSITVVSTFTIVMRYMFHARDNIGSMNTIHYEITEEEYPSASI